MYWAEALAAQREDQELATQFKPLFETLKANEQKIVSELAAVQGKAVDMGGYYMPSFEKTSQAMRPSVTFNTALDALKA